jgi:hypothetical protein
VVLTEEKNKRKERTKTTKNYRVCNYMKKSVERTAWRAEKELEKQKQKRRTNKIITMSEGYMSIFFDYSMGGTRGEGKH